MDLVSLAPWLGVLIVAVAAFVVVRARRTRARRAAPPAGAPPATDEDNYLDSSHISGPIVRPRTGSGTGDDRR
ncbi:MAG: hypothetical protein U1F58_04955 [Burkholderiales bacterium]